VFGDVSHLTTADLERLMATAPERLVLLDVRAAEEFALSRITGAVHVDPAARSAAEVARRVGGLEGKVVIAYCAIGLRSARLLVRIGQALKEQGASELYNLEGGVFRWRNEQRRLVDEAGGDTRRIHPYSTLWRQFLVDPPSD
jgi:rhodanese-related sulfurtransferase